MKIGLVGAPGAGKTKFSEELKKIIIDEGFLEDITLIDGYVDELRLNTLLEYGEYGDFVDDLQVVFKRREWELGWADYNAITCGTVLDSVVHNFVRTDHTPRNRRELAVHTTRLKTIASTFGLLYTETWDYDYAFYLPTDDVMGKALVDILSTYRAPVMTFNPEIKDDEKVRTAFNAIVALEKNPSPQAEEPGVRGSGEEGASERDSADDVPDVPKQG